MLDVTAVAHGNGPARKAAADAATGADASGRLVEFRQLVAGSQCCTNATADKVLTYGRLDGVVDTRRHFAQRVGDAEGRTVFESIQGGALAGREGFEDLWDHGRRFVYGAVNAGGMGAEGYGDLCLVFDDVETAAPDALAVFPEDSVSRYADGLGVVDAARAQADATAWADRACLAVSELGVEALGLDDSDWPVLVCSTGRYLEVVMAGDLPVSALSEVRLRASVLADYRSLWERAFADDELPPDEANQAAAYDVLRSWRRSSGVASVGVPDQEERA